MKYVIKYTDGSYNRGAGFPCALEEATVYGTEDEATYVASELMDVAGVVEYKSEPTFSLDALMGAIEAATRTIKVCVPSQDFYRRSADWADEELTYVDPARLIHALKELT